MSTFDVNCGCEGTLGLQSVDEKVNVIKTWKKVEVRASESYEIHYMSILYFF